MVCVNKNMCFFLKKKKKIGKILSLKPGRILLEIGSKTLSQSLLALWCCPYHLIDINVFFNYITRGNTLYAHYLN